MSEGGMLVLHGSRCLSAEFKAHKAQLSRSRWFGALNSPEKYRNPSGVFWMRGDPPTGRDDDIVARNIVRKSQVPFARCFGCMGLAFGMLECRKYNSRNVEACQTDTSIAIFWNQKCQSIFACAYDILGSWNPLLKPWIAGWLRIREKVTNHAKWRRMDSTNRRKHSAVVQMIAKSRACVLWMFMEQQISLFQHRPWPEESICPSVCRKKAVTLTPLVTCYQADPSQHWQDRGSKAWEALLSQMGNATFDSREMAAGVAVKLVEWSVHSKH